MRIFGHFLFSAALAVLLVCFCGVLSSGSATAEDESTSLASETQLEKASAAETNPALIPVDRKNEWWVKRHEANKARIAQGNVDFLLIGDSITHIWDNAGAEVQEYYYGDRNYVNMGFGGDLTQHVLWRLEDAPMDKIHPKAAMLLIGANNVCVKRPNIAEETAFGIRACVDKLLSLFPDIKILVLPIFSTGQYPDFPVRKTIKDVNVLLPGMFVGEKYKNVTLKDIDYLWLGEGGKIPKYLMPDYDHPGKLGCKLWGAEVEEWVANALGVVPKEPMQ